MFRFVEKSITKIITIIIKKVTSLHFGLNKIKYSIIIIHDSRAFEILISSMKIC